MRCLAAKSCNSIANVPDNTRGLLFAIGGAMAASMFFIPYRQAMQTMPAESFVLGVFIVALALNAGLNFTGIGSFTWNKHVVFGGIGFAALSIVGNYCIGRSLAGLGTALTVVVLRTQVLMVIILAVLLLGERLNRVFIFALVLTAVGYLILKSSAEFEQTQNLASLGWGLGAALSFATANVWLKKIIEHINPIAVNVLRLFLGTTFLLLFPQSWQNLAAITQEQWLLCGLSAFFGPSLSRNLQMYAIKYIPVSRSILISMLTPVITLFIAWLLWNEWPSASALIGATIIMLGLSLPFFFAKSELQAQLET